MGSCFVIGASVRALAEEARLAGWKVTAADLFIDRDLRAIANCYRLDCLSDLSKIQSIPIASQDRIFLAGGMENHLEVVERLGSRATLWGPSFESLQALRSIERWKQWASESGCAFPHSISIRDASCLADFDEGAWLIKSMRSSGGFHVRAFRQAKGEKADLQDGDFLQRRINGKSCSAVILFGEEQCAVAQVAESISASEWNAPSEFAYCGNILGGWCNDTNSLRSKLQRLGQRIQADLNLTEGWIGVDFIVDDANELHLLEINPRYTASMELGRIQLGIPWCPHPNTHNSFMPSFTRQPDSCIAKAILYAPQPISITSQHTSIMWSERRTTAGSQSNWIADIPTEGTEIAVGMPIVSLFTIGRDQTSLMSALHAYRDKILRMLEI
ncbi:MAG: ATP-grasp domain-containing protein [Pirellulales bacterium]